MSHLYSHTVKTIEELQISPPPGSVPAISLPLTFFDIPWLVSHPVQRVFFYNLPISDTDTINVSQFRQTILPNLTSSLSIALRYFYPFAARLLAPPRPGKPYLFYSDGDSVPVAVAETSLDFDQVTTDLPKDVALLHPLLPKLPPAELQNDGTTVSPLLAVKITLFPNSGICIGFEFRRVAGDGSSFTHFVKSWASISKSGAVDLSLVEKSPPCHDRSLIKDPRNLVNILLEQVGNFKDPREDDLNQSRFSGKVRATFVVDGEDLARLKASVNFPVSAFAAASALVWTNLMRSLDLEEAEDGQGKIGTYLIVADFRGRLEPKLSTTYCLTMSPVSMKRRELLGDDGFMVAAKALADGIQGIEGALGRAEEWISGFEEMFKLGKAVTVAGSPRQRVYETDNGFRVGRPKKAEHVDVDFAESVYFSDARDEERGGLEFGLALPKAEMDAFVALFQQRFKQLHA